ncbi:glycosyl hydrolase family 95 catalytic domain-containing protein, partial [Clostridium butyricum]
LYPYKIGKFGQLQEWFKDFEEFEKGHRHLSHLFGLYPGNEINEDNNKEIFEASRKSLERRLNNGGGHTGWSCSWAVCLFARLKDSESANKYLEILLKQLTFSNLLNVCPPFQIDGNFGGTAAISEMIIQSNKGYIEILPCIPKKWKDGSVKGIKARGGFELDFEWNNGYIKEIYIKSGLNNGICKIKLNTKTIKLYSKLKYEIISEKDNLMKHAEDKVLFSSNMIVAKIEKGYTLKLSFL